MRTTVDIDDPILKEVKALQAREGKPLGRLISDLLARALHQERRTARQERGQPAWICRAMGSRIDLEDKEALYAATEGHSHAEAGEKKR
jgi:hypothetical protein